MMSGVGVARGDTFFYNYTCYFLSNDSNAVSPPGFTWINQTDYFLINVTGVSESVINFETTMHMQNGSNVAGSGSIDIGSAMSSMSGYNPMGVNSYFFMSSNVGMMGKMFPYASVSPTVNDTMMMSYAGGQRLTDHLSMVANQNGMMNQSDLYFDQSTGAMVEWRQQNVQTSGSLQTNGTQLLKLTSSSVWDVPEFPISSIALVLAAMIMVGLIVMVTRMKKNQIKT